MASTDLLLEHFAENLRSSRAIHQLSQEDVAFAAAIHRTQISFIESGKRLPRLDTLVKLAGALNVPPATLLDGCLWVPRSINGGEFRIVGMERRVEE